MRKRFSWKNYLLRLAFALILVFATYNPSGVSYYHWVADGFDMNDTQTLALMALGGIVLIIGWVMFLRASFRSLGPIGILLASGFFGVLIWVVFTFVPIPEDSVEFITYMVELALAGVLSVGMSWSHVRRRLSGQLDVDEADI